MNGLPLKQAVEIAAELSKKLKPVCFEQKLMIAGSVRRADKSHVKDIEILCIPKPHPSGARLKRHSDWIKGVMSMGQIIKGKSLNTGRYWKINHENKIMVDVFVADPNNWGYMLMIRTGPADFSKKMLGLFKSKGFKSVNGYPVDQMGRADQPTDADDRLILETEEQVFQYLDMEFVKPSDRSNYHFGKQKIRR